MSDLGNLESGYYDFTDTTFDERVEAKRFNEEISDAFDNHQYEVVIEKAEEARKLIAQVRERCARIEKFLSSEYAVCPVCGDNLERGNIHYCDDSGQQALLACAGAEDFCLKSSFIGDFELVSLIARFNNGYNEFETRLKINSHLLAKNPDVKIETENHWRGESSAADLIAAMNEMWK